LTTDELRGLLLSAKAALHAFTLADEMPVGLVDPDRVEIEVIEKVPGSPTETVTTRATRTGTDILNARSVVAAIERALTEKPKK